MVEGSGFAGRREERLRSERLRRFIDSREDIVVVPDISGEKGTGKAQTKKRKKSSSI